MNENDCIFISSRGILKSCDIHSLTPFSSAEQLYNYDFSKLKENCTIYVCNKAIPAFTNIIDKINNRFILVSGDCDVTVPNGIFTTEEHFFYLINSDKLIHWYAQNCVYEHPKITKLPIGLDYHTLSFTNPYSIDWGEKKTPQNQEQQLIKIKNNSLSFWEREMKCYSNFHFIPITDFRKDAVSKLDKDIMVYETMKTTRLNCWENQSKYTFIISPHGGGLDCHRTWEGLLLGCIVIVKTSPLDSMYEDLPVLIVDDWNYITDELLIKTINDYKTKTFNYEKLLLKYWMDKITNVKTI